MSRIYSIAPVPDARRYARVLGIVKPTDGQRAMLSAHRRAPGRTLSAQDLAAVVGRRHAYANLHYGRFAHRVADALGIAPDLDEADGGKPLWTTTIARGWRIVGGPWVWQLYEEVAEAVDGLPC